MNTHKAIEDRSIRKYKKDEIQKEIIEDILKCGCLSPSAKNRQPWYFIVLSGKNKNEIAKIMIDGFTNEHKEYDKKVLKCDNSVICTANVIIQAPILILIFRPKDDNWLGDSLSIGACVENMCLRATELGLGTLWIRDVVYTSDKIASYFGKKNLELNCALSIGILNEKPKSRPRKKLDDIIEWY